VLILFVVYEPLGGRGVALDEKRRGDTRHALTHALLPHTAARLRRRVWLSVSTFAGVFLYLWAAASIAKQYSALVLGLSWFASAAVGCHLERHFPASLVLW